MIHMLSAFNLSDGADFDPFSRRYVHFVADLRAAGLIESSSGVGRRAAGTPMDTNTDKPRRHFTVMQFCDRALLDAAYARIAGDVGTHNGIQTAVLDGLFTCWELEDAR